MPFVIAMITLDSGLEEYKKLKKAVEVFDRYVQYLEDSFELFEDSDKANAEYDKILKTFEAIDHVERERKGVSSAVDKRKIRSKALIKSFHTMKKRGNLRIKDPENYLRRLENTEDQFSKLANSVYDLKDFLEDVSKDLEYFQMEIRFFTDPFRRD